MKIIYLILPLLFTTSILSAQEEDFPFAGMSFRTFLETQPDISNFNLNGNEKMESHQFSAFLNMVYPVSKKALIFHSLEWSQNNYTIHFPDGNQKDVPVWLHSIPSLSSIDFTTGIFQEINNKWEGRAFAAASLTYGSSEIELEKQFNYTGILQFARKWKSGTEIALGGFYYNGVDGNIALPVLSFVFRKGRWGANGMLPLDLVIFYEFNPKLKLTMSSDLNFSGFRYKKQQVPQNGFPTAKSAGLVQTMIGPTIDWRFAKYWELSFNTGFFSQQFTIQTDTGEEEVLKFKDSIYLEMGLSYVIPGK